MPATSDVFSRWWVRSFRVSTAGAVLLIGIAGCGGKDQGKPKGSSLEVKAPQVVQATPRGPVGPAARVDKPRAKVPARPELRPGEALYAVLAEPQPEPRPEERFLDDENLTGGNVDRYAVETISTGLNSASFVITGPSGNGGAEATGTPANISFPPGFGPVPGSSAEAGAVGLARQIRCNKDGSIMTLVPGGRFVRGHTSGPTDVQPEHQAHLEHFYMDVEEITFEQFERFRDSLRREKKTTPRAPDGRVRSQRDPVTGISWGDAAAYARWAGKELPTEAQWEKAARGTQGFEHPWGNGVHLWHRPRKPGQIDPVGSFPTDKSPYGVLDLAGNAREWCADWYSATSYLEATRKSGDGAVVQNPTGPAFPEADKSRVVRGGDPQWRAWTRSHASNLERPIDVGFRCVLTFRPNSGPGGKAGNR